MGRPKKPPLYVLPHGIEVIGEYPPNRHLPYWRVRIRPHRFFPGVRQYSGGIVIHRSRALLASRLGRALTPIDHVHHEDEVRDNDAASNLKLLTAAEHNRHHKTGSKHTAASKAKTSASVRAAIACGKMAHRRVPKGTEHGMAKLDDEKVRRIRSSPESARSLARQFRVSKQAVLSVRQRKTWRHIP